MTKTDSKRLHEIENGVKTMRARGENSIMNHEKKNEKKINKMMRIGVAADHGGYELKVKLKKELEKAGYDVKDFGAK